MGHRSVGNAWEVGGIVLGEVTYGTGNGCDNDFGTGFT